MTPIPNASERFELGIYSFVESTEIAQTGQVYTPGERMRNLLEEITLADQVGLDVYGVGEHHRGDYVSSAPAVVLAAAAARTERIRLTSAVTVLSSDDPVRVFQQFATVDLISRGRAEIMAGRGSFIESFPLFGYDLRDYESLFEEKLELLLRLRDNERVTWSGKHRPPLNDAGVYPRPEQDPLPIWVAVGGTPQSVVRAARLGLPMALGIIGGRVDAFVPFVDLYREAARRSGFDPAKLPLSLNVHGFVADDLETALRETFPAAKLQMDRLGRERGWPPMSFEQYRAGAAPGHHLLIGDPEQVAEKIVHQHRLFRHQRQLVQLSVGSLPHALVLKAIELLGTKVAPLVRAELGQSPTE